MQSSTAGGAGDPFATAEVRRRVLAAWSDSPARFREDANAEEDLVRGGYRDRLLVELAQNAADAATRQGVPGRLRLELAGDTLSAANTGAPLDAGGVQGLSTLRASAKRDAPGSVGRFGVGFAAVLAVSDAPAVVSTTGGVRFSATGTRAAVAALPGLDDELARRAGAVPVLRLPWPAEGTPPEGFVIEVVVDGAVRILTRRDTAAGISIADDGATTVWRVASRTGELSAELLADRPVEERGRRAWTVTVALPSDDDGRPRPLPAGQVVHAPTPSDEPLSVPVRMIAPFPLGPDRRSVLPGPVTDALVDAAAGTVADLLAAWPPDPALLALVPRVGLAGAALDAAIGSAVLDRLRTTAWLPVAGEDGRRQAPSRAAVLDDATEERVAALTGVLPGLLPAPWSRRGDLPALTALGVRRIGLAEAVEAVRGVERPPAWWARLYASLDGADREELAALPVPLADGRTAHGPAGVLLPGPELPVTRLGALGLRLADPAAVGLPEARRLLERLGARPAAAAVVLADPAVRTAVETSMDVVDDALPGAPAPEELAEAVLALVAAARPTAGELPWLAELALPDDDGGWAPAGELVLPGSPLAEVLAPGSLGTLDRDFAAAADPDALRAVGVLDSFAVVRAEDPDDLDVDGADRWADAVLDRLPGSAGPPEWPPLLAVRDLELVDDWPRALPLLAALPAEVRGDVVIEGVPVPGYLRWWLSTSPVLDGARPDRLRHPSSEELRGLYEPATASPAVLALLRPPATVDDVLLDVDGAIDLLGRLGDPGRTVPPAVLRTVYARLAVALEGIEVEPPVRVRVAPDRVVADAVVLDAPYLLPLVDAPVVPAGGAPGAVADLLDLPLAGELVRRAAPGRPDRRIPWAQLPGAALAAARLGLTELSGEVAEHRALAVAGRPVAWWPEGEVDHVDGSPAALGRALAWRAGAWSARSALAEAFACPERAEQLAAEDAVGDGRRE